jgi:diacylglycerol kinase family enzyme
LISQNPKAGARSGQSVVDELVKLLESQKFQVQVTRDIDRLSRDATALYEAGRLRAVVAAGGDGTVALVANRTPLGTPISILPLGTENLLAKYLDMDADPERVCGSICRGELMQIDAGRAGDRLFLLMLGCGFDAEVVRRLHSERKGHIHHLSYAKPILDSIRNYEYPEVRVYCDALTNADGEAGEPLIRACWAFVVNLPRYAVGLQIAPQAIGNDGLLDVCTFKEGSLWNGLRYLSGILLGQHQDWRDFATVQARRVRIESEGRVPYQLDGDPGGYLPVEVEVLPGRITLLGPMKGSHEAENDASCQDEGSTREQ